MIAATSSSVGEASFRAVQLTPARTPSREKSREGVTPHSLTA